MKFHLSYRLIIGSMTLMAMILAGSFLTISYIYRLQDNTSLIIQENVESLEAANELEDILYQMRTISLNYVIDKDSAWITMMKEKQAAFNQGLEKARGSANTVEETNLLQQITALFSNFEQNLNNALSLQKQGYITKANGLLLHGSRDLINTIEEKSREFKKANQSEKAVYEERVRKNEEFIRKAMYALGFGGMIIGLALGWLIARIILNPIYKLVLKVRDAAGSEVVEHIKMSPGKELEEIDYHINRMITRINKAHDDLEKNQQLLEKSSRLAAIGKVAPAIAHEIRNPLAAIKMLIYSMLNESDISPEKREDLQIITREIERMEGFLQDFLKYARPSKPQFRETDIVPVLRETIHLIRPKMDKHSIHLEEHFNTDQIRIEADADQLKQVFMNLMLNAIDAMGEGGTLRISTLLDPSRQSQVGKRFLLVQVADTGSGIAESIRETIFDPFVKNKDKGVGLGLSISQRIAELHHGWIDAANNTDAGATFTVHLPIE